MFRPRFIVLLPQNLLELEKVLVNGTYKEEDLPCMPIKYHSIGAMYNCRALYDLPY